MFWLYLALSVLAGALLGAFFFGGLWWTVQKMTGSSRPYLLAAASFIVRNAVLLAGLYLLLTGGWPYLLAAMAGLLVARTVTFYMLKPHEKRAPSPGLKGGR